MTTPRVAFLRMKKTNHVQQLSSYWQTSIFNESPKPVVSELCLRARGPSVVRSRGSSARDAPGSDASVGSC